VIHKMHTKKIIAAGKKPGDASKALIMVHGRGANAEDILSLAQYFPVKEFALLAPQATNNTWYPLSFMVPPAANEPWLSSALQILKDLVDDTVAIGIAKENIYFLGFSQGACLTLEFVARNAASYGGVAAFTGGLIGDKINKENYRGNFSNTPIFIGTGDPDPHVPVERVRATTLILKNMDADVTEKIYPGIGHTINADEIEMVNTLIFRF
jgi:phospholipase/carboxylesterase